MSKVQINFCSTSEIFQEFLHIISHSGRARLSISNIFQRVLELKKSKSRCENDFKNVSKKDKQNNSNSLKGLRQNPNCCLNLLALSGSTSFVPSHDRYMYKGSGSQVHNYFVRTKKN